MKYYAHSSGMRPELTLFGLKDWVVQQYTKASTSIAEMEQPADPNSLRNRMYDWISEFGQTASRASMYLLVALRPGYFGIPLPELTYLEQSSQQLFNKTYGLWKRIAYVFHDMLSIQELFECMEIQPSMKISEHPMEYHGLASPYGAGMKICDCVSTSGGVMDELLEQFLIEAPELVQQASDDLLALRERFR